MPPFVGYFPSGFDPVKQTSSGLAGIQVYRNKHMHKRTELVVCPDGRSVEFVGTSYAGEASSGHRSMYALGVFDKETQTLKVMHIGANKIFRLEPKVKGLEYNKPSLTPTEEEISPDQWTEKRRKTDALFGSTRQIVMDESEKRKLSCILSFINHLVKYKDQQTMDGVSSSKQHKIPNIIRHRFSTMFAVSESTRMPHEKINLLISYILVLTLFSDEFQTDYSDISKDLRMNKSSVEQIFEHLGCKILKQNGAFYATLPVPLTFPQLRQKKRLKRN